MEPARANGLGLYAQAVQTLAQELGLLNLLEHLHERIHYLWIEVRA